MLNTELKDFDKEKEEAKKILSELSNLEKQVGGGDKQPATIEEILEDKEILNNIKLLQMVI